MNSENNTQSPAEFLQRIQTLQKRLAAKDSAIAEKDSAIAEQHALIEQLREQVRLLKALEYARSSEKKRPQTHGEGCARQLWLFDEAEFLARGEQTLDGLSGDHGVARCDTDCSSSAEVVEDDKSVKSRKNADASLFPGSFRVRTSLCVSVHVKMTHFAG